MLETAVAIAVLLVLSAFFSGCETALTVASRPVMHELERKGNRRAGAVLALQREEGRLIGAILLGNNVVNISASTLSTALLIGLFGEAGVAYATVGMTVLILVFSEILPKTYAFRFADRTALAMAPLIRPVVVVLAPITQGIQVFIQALFRLFGVDFAGKRDTLVSSSQMLRGAIETAAPKTKSASASCCAASSTWPRSRWARSWSTARTCSASTPTSRRPRS